VFRSRGTSAVLLRGRDSAACQAGSRYRASRASACAAQLAETEQQPQANLQQGPDPFQMLEMTPEQGAERVQRFFLDEKLEIRSNCAT